MGWTERSRAPDRRQNEDAVDIHGRRLLGQSRPGRLGRVVALARSRARAVGVRAGDHQQSHGAAGAISAFEILKRPMRVRLFTDSNYLRQGITTWLPAWKSRGWRTADKKPVKNQDPQRLEQRSRATKSNGVGCAGTAAIRTTSGPTSSPGPRSARGALGGRRAPPKGRPESRPRCSSRPESARPRPSEP